MAPKMIFLCRHGETAYTLSGQHTSVTDLPLTENGKREAEQLGKALETVAFDAVFTSPLVRARETASIAGFPDAVVEEALFEWRYGQYEGVTSKEIHEKNPRWNLFEDGAPGGESIEQVERRSRRLIERLFKMEGNIALFSSGHISRVIGAVWVGLPAHHGKFLKLNTASLSKLGFEHDYPVICAWNETSHLLH